MWYCQAAVNVSEVLHPAPAFHPWPERFRPKRVCGMRLLRFLGQRVPSTFSDTEIFLPV